MNRIATYAGALTLTLVAFGANAQTAQPNWTQAASADGRQLIAALDSCQQFVEEARRVRCESIARKTNGQATQLSGNVGTFEGGWSVSGAPAGRQDN